MTSKCDFKTEANIDPERSQKGYMLEVILGGHFGYLFELILGVQKGKVGTGILSFLALWATLGAQWGPKAPKVDQSQAKRRLKATQVVLRE